MKGISSVGVLIVLIAAFMGVFAYSQGWFGGMFAVSPPPSYQDCNLPTAPNL